MSKLQGPDRDLSVTGQDKSSGVTDLPFVDLIITHSAMMLPVKSSKSSCLITSIKDLVPEQIHQEGEIEISLLCATLGLHRVMNQIIYSQMQALVPLQTCPFLSP